MSVHHAAAAFAVTQPVVRRWLSLGLLPGPPWTIQQLQEVRDLTDPESRRRGSRAAHSTMARWNSGCSCTDCRRMQSDAARERGRARSQSHLPVEVREQCLAAPALAGHSGRCSVILASPLTRCGDWPRPIDPEWSEKLETALTAARRNDLKDGTNAAYVHGCVCEECREHQQIRMGRSRGQVR